jgi:hypothetical protein
LNGAACVPGGGWNCRARATRSLPACFGLAKVPSLICLAGLGACLATRVGFSAVSSNRAATSAEMAGPSLLHPADSKLAESRAASRARFAVAAAAALVTFLTGAGAAGGAVSFLSKASMLAMLFSSFSSLAPPSSGLVSGVGTAPTEATSSAVTETSLVGVSVTLAAAWTCALYWLRVAPSRTSWRLSPLAPPLLNPHVEGLPSGAVAILGRFLCSTESEEKNRRSTQRVFPLNTPSRFELVRSITRTCSPRNDTRP